MLEGRIQQDGLPQDFYERPATQAVARFFGTKNFVPGTVKGTSFESALGALQLGHEHPAGDGLLVIRQEAMEVGPRVRTASRRPSSGPCIWARTFASGLTPPMCRSSSPPRQGCATKRSRAITLRLPKEQAWIVPTEDRIL